LSRLHIDIFRSKFHLQGTFALVGIIGTWKHLVLVFRVKAAGALSDAANSPLDNVGILECTRIPCTSADAS